jgi:hypothetical protein
MNFLQENQQSVQVLCVDYFFKELKKAPEWMVYTPDGLNVVLRIRNEPLGPWTEYQSPDPLTMTAEEWLDFTQTVRLICETKRQERFDEEPEQPNR